MQKHTNVMKGLDLDQLPNPSFESVYTRNSEDHRENGKELEMNSGKEDHSRQIN